MPQKTIYIIDDDPIYQLVTEKLIQKSNLFQKSVHFRNGYDALNYLKDSGSLPEVILLDIEMPQIDAWGFLEEVEPILESLGGTCEIHIVSSSIAAEDSMRAQSYPLVTSFMSKPIDLIKLEQIAKG